MTGNIGEVGLLLPNLGEGINIPDGPYGPLEPVLKGFFFESFFLFLEWTLGIFLIFLPILELVFFEFIIDEINELSFVI